MLASLLVWQASAILVIACVAGVPLGVAAGRWAWTSFASSLGVVPAARNRPAIILRAE